MFQNTTLSKFWSGLANFVSGDRSKDSIVSQYTKGWNSKVTVAGSSIFIGFSVQEIWGETISCQPSHVCTTWSSLNSPSLRLCVYMYTHVLSSQIFARFKENRACLFCTFSYWKKVIAVYISCVLKLAIELRVYPVHNLGNIFCPFKKGRHVVAANFNFCNCILLMSCV